jgi:shikimate 5-dehydrogenase/shikimate kinase/3-dehydroquinate dehydratase
MMTLLQHAIRPEVRSFEPDASIVLVGSRGSGKRSLGFIGATTLGRRFITEDYYFRVVTGISRGEYLQKNGNEKFRNQNVEVLRRMLHDNRRRHVIECGMGSLAGDAQVLLKEYAKTNPVVYIVRNSKRISQLLNLDEHGAGRLEQADLTHRFCSNLEYYNLYDPTCEGEVDESTQEQDRVSPQYSFKLKIAKQDFSSFLDFVTARSLNQPGYESPFSIAAVPAELRSFTYNLTVSFSGFIQGSLDLEKLELDSGGDVVELKIDIPPPGSLKEIAKQVALIRRKMQRPIIFDIDRQFKNSLSEASYFDLLQYGLRLGVEYVVVDIDCHSDFLQRVVLAKGRTKVIGDYLDVRTNCTTAWVDGSLLTQYFKAEKLGCDLVRISRVNAQGDDNENIQHFRQTIQALPRSGTPPPLIAYNLSTMGHASQILNRTFTPVTAVTHFESGGSIKNDPESLTAQEAMQSLFQRQVFDHLHFYIVGTSVFYSLSPAMHNVAYRICGMNHDYQIYQTSHLEELHQLAQDPQFGGASISHPFKVGIVEQLRTMSKHASAIGAVNTLLPIRAWPDESVPDDTMAFLLRQASQRGRAGPVISWYGENTDWIGLTKCLQRNLSPRNAIQRKTTGLIIGAGGMARAAIYSMIQLGCRNIYIYNRTIEHAERVAHHFNKYFNSANTGSPQRGYGGVVEVLKSMDEPWPSGPSLPTIVISCIPAHSIANIPAANLILPEQWLASPSGGVVIEVRSFIPTFYLLSH